MTSTLFLPPSRIKFLSPFPQTKMNRYHDEACLDCGSIDELLWASGHYDASGGRDHCIRGLGGVRLSLRVTVHLDPEPVADHERV